MKNKKNKENMYRYELISSFKVDDTWFESNLSDIIYAKDMIEAYSKVNEIVCEINKSNIDISYRLYRLDREDF